MRLQPMGEINDRFMEHFRLNSITIMEHPVLGNLHLDFCQDDVFPAGVYTSVIIVLRMASMWGWWILCCHTDNTEITD